jgi:hypothetical protein
MHVFPDPLVPLFAAIGTRMVSARSSTALKVRMKRGDNLIRYKGPRSCSTDAKDVVVGVSGHRQVPQMDEGHL